MDLGVGIPPEVNSIHHDEEHSLHSPNSVRKRKPQLEQLVPPVSKHKFRHGCSSCSSSDRESPTAHHMVPHVGSEGGIDDETETGPELHEGPEQIEGSSCKGGSSRLLEESDSNMALDLEGHMETSPKIFVPHFEPPAKPSSPEGMAFKDGLYSLDSRTVKNNKDSDCQLPVSGVGDGDDEPDCQLPVSVVDEGDGECMEEECPDEPIEELTLSCDNVGLNTPGLSSARWSIKQDAVPGAGRPTIDQEFEHYFSMFML